MAAPGAFITGGAFELPPSPWWSWTLHAAAAVLDRRDDLQEEERVAAVLAELVLADDVAAVSEQLGKEVHCGPRVRSTDEVKRRGLTREHVAPSN